MTPSTNPQKIPGGSYCIWMIIKTLSSQASLCLAVTLDFWLCLWHTTLFPPYSLLFHRSSCLAPPLDPSDEGLNFTFLGCLPWPPPWSRPLPSGSPLMGWRWGEGWGQVQFCSLWTPCLAVGHICMCEVKKGGNEREGPVISNMKRRQTIRVVLRMQEEKLKLMFFF